MVCRCVCVCLCQTYTYTHDNVFSCLSIFGPPLPEGPTLVVARPSTTCSCTLANYFPHFCLLHGCRHDVAPIEKAVVSTALHACFCVLGSREVGSQCRTQMRAARIVIESNTLHVVGVCVCMYARARVLACAVACICMRVYICIYAFIFTDFPQ